MDRRTFVIAAVAAIGGSLSGCVEAPGAGPPPWAPAHGRRRKHASGATLVYDTGLGVYVVSEYPGVYFHNDRFYRMLNDAWQVSVRIDGPWQPAPARSLPPGLARRGGPPGRAGGPPR